MRIAKCDVFTGDDAVFPVRITYSSPMSKEEVSELKEFLALWIRTREREIVSASPGDNWRNK